MAFSLLQEILIVTDIFNKQTSFLNKTSGEQLAMTINIAPEVIYSVAVYNEEKQKQKDEGMPICYLNLCR